MLVAQLPADLPAAIFVVQHVSPHSPSMLPEILQRAGALPAKAAENGERIERSRIYVAPPDYHLLVTQGHVHLSHGPRENRTRPAVDPLFRSAAVAYGARIVGVILSGYLDDGTAGLLAVKRCGGVEALQQFFTHMPADSGMAFVVAIHLSPHYESTLPDLLQKYTKMPVVQIKDGVEVRPNHVYVIPPDRDIGILHGTLQLMERIARSGWPMTINSFLESLAEDQGERAIGVILSGAGTDGTLGTRAIKAKSGLVVVQEPATAAQEGMPRSATSTGLVDYVLPIADIPQKLMTYASRAIFKRAGGRAAPRRRHH